MHRRAIVVLVRLGVGLGTVVSGPAFGADAPPVYAGSATEAKEAETGRRTIQVLRTDITGDGRPEHVVVQRITTGLRIAVFAYTDGDVEDDPRAFRTVFVEAVPGARRVQRLATEGVAGDPAPDVVAHLEAPSPDERAVYVRVIGQHKGAMATLAAVTYLTGGPKDDAVALGDASPHVVLEDVDADGTRELLWTTGPETLEVNGRDGPVRFIVGARQSTLRFDPALGRFGEPGPERFVDFLPPRRPTEVEATAQVPKIWGTAQAFWGADGDLETAWTVRYADHADQALTVRFGAGAVVNMVRVVPGCGGGADEWKQYRTVRRFAVHLSNGVRFTLQDDGKGPWPANVRGIGIFPLEGNFGRQLLIFLNGPASVDWARFTMLAAGRRPRRRARHNDEVCLSEISFH